MDKKTQNIDTKKIIDLIENDSSNNWDDLCNKCSSLVREAGISDAEIDEIVKNCKIG